jgi:hypothetical protein
MNGGLVCGCRWSDLMFDNGGVNPVTPLDRRGGP